MVVYTFVKKLCFIGVNVVCVGGGGGAIVNVWSFLFAISMLSV